MEVTAADTFQVGCYKSVLLPLGATLIWPQDAGLEVQNTGDISDAGDSYRLFAEACLDFSCREVAIAHHTLAPAVIFEISVLFDERVNVRLNCLPQQLFCAVLEHDDHRIADLRSHHAILD